MGGTLYEALQAVQKCPMHEQHLVKSAGPRDFQMLMQAAVASLDGICTVNPLYYTYSRLDEMVGT